MHARTLEVLDRIGVADAADRPRRAGSPRFTVRDRDRVLLTVPFDGLPSRYPYALMVSQAVTEARARRPAGRARRPGAPAVPS